MNAVTEPHDKTLDGVISTDADGRPVVTFERHLAHPIERVWNAITDPDEAIQWLGQLTIDPRVGGRIQLVPGSNEPAREASVDHGAITAFDPPVLLEYWGIIDGPRSEGHRHVYRWELREEPGGCAITFSNTFGKDEPRVSNSIVCGWHLTFEHLVDQLEGRTTSWDDADRERIVELYWHYRNTQR